MRQGKTRQGKARQGKARHDKKIKGSNDGKCSRWGGIGGVCSSYVLM